MRPSSVDWVSSAGPAALLRAAGVLTAVDEDGEGDQEGLPFPATSNISPILRIPTSSS